MHRLVSNKTQPETAPQNPENASPEHVPILKKADARHFFHHTRKSKPGVFFALIWCVY
jgi:hypothetical protein